MNQSSVSSASQQASSSSHQVAPMIPSDPQFNGTSSASQDQSMDMCLTSAVAQEHPPHHVPDDSSQSSSLPEPFLSWHEIICPEHRSIEAATHAFPVLDSNAFALENQSEYLYEHPTIRLSQPLRFRLGLNNMPIEPILRCLSIEELMEKEFRFRQYRLTLITRAMSFIRIQFKMAIERFDTTVRSHHQWLEKLLHSLVPTNISLGVINVDSFKDCVHIAIR